MYKRFRNRIQMMRASLVCRSHLENWREASNALRLGRKGTSLRFRNGFSLTGTERDDVAAIFHEIFIERCYTPSWFYRPESDHTVFDIGANIGVFCTFLACVAPGIRIRAFEPHSVTFDTLLRNLAANRLTDRVSADQVAIGREAGVVHFSGLKGMDSGHEAATSYGRGDPVMCTPLAAVLNDGEQVDLLKIDTEGAEVDILEPAPTDLRDRVARVVVEYHDLGKRDEVLRALEVRRYRCYVEPTRGYEHHLGLIYGTRG